MSGVKGSNACGMGKVQSKKDTFIPADTHIPDSFGFIGTSRVRESYPLFRMPERIENRGSNRSYSDTHSRIGRSRSLILFRKEQFQPPSGKKKVEVTFPFFHGFFSRISSFQDQEFFGRLKRKEGIGQGVGISLFLLLSGEWAGTNNNFIGREPLYRIHKT